MLENCHIENYVELATMISEKVKNCQGIAVPVTSSDKEYEVDKLPGILSCYHIVFQKKGTEYLMRERECFCLSCQKNQYSKCSNLKYTGKMRIVQPVLLGERQPKWRETIRNGIDEAGEEEEFVVEDVIGHRDHRVSWQKFYFLN